MARGEPLAIDGHQARYRIIGNKIQLDRVDGDLPAEGILEVILQRRYYLAGKAGVVAAFEEMGIELKIAAYLGRQACKDDLRVAKDVGKVDILKYGVEGGRYLVLDLVDYLMDTGIIVIEGLAVDIGRIGDILYGDVVDALDRDQLGKGIPYGPFGLDDPSIGSFSRVLLSDSLLVR